jgi:hypothetical protein
MTEFAYTSTIREIDCPRCGQVKGCPCRTPKGRICQTPHGERFVEYVQSITTEEFIRRHAGISNGGPCNE